MRNKNQIKPSIRISISTACVLLISIIFTLPLNAETLSGEQLYRKLQNGSFQKIIHHLGL